MQPASLTANADAAIGIFDSGVGGLSVLHHIRADLPHEHLIYFADSGYAPYGDKTDAEIVARSLTVAQFLLAQDVKALVVACNTATAAAISALRARYPTLILVGIEPGLKPAAQQSASKHVGVLATRSTIASVRFNHLRDAIATNSGVHFHSAPCVGLADLIEQGALLAPRTTQLLQQHLTPLVAQRVDTLVLGCTHYPFVRPLIEEILNKLGAPAMHIIDTGQPVSRQLTRLIDGARLRRDGVHGHVENVTDAKTAISAAMSETTTQASGNLTAYTTASASSLQYAFYRLLKLTPEVTALSI